MPHVALDRDGFIIATHRGLVNNPLQAPEGGRLATVSDAMYDQIALILDLGKQAKLKGDEVTEHVQTQPKAVKFDAVTLKQLRHDKMSEIGDQSVASRDRKFPAYPHVPLAAHLWGRFGDTIALLAAGRKKESDMIYTRNLRSGHYERISIKDLLDEMQGVSELRELLRKHDQSYRDKVEFLYNDVQTDEKKFAELRALEIPEHLGISLQSTHKKLVIDKK
jgi:hypothetical protein